MRRQDARRLARIVEIRTLRARAAEMAAGAAAARLQTATAECRNGAAAVDAAMAGWRRSVDEGFHLGLSQHWAGQIRRAQDHLAELERDRADALGEKDLREAEWAKALGGSKAADQLLEQALHRLRRRQEEAALAAAEDRDAHRRRAS